MITVRNNLVKLCFAVVVLPKAPSFVGAANGLNATSFRSSNDNSVGNSLRGRRYLMDMAMMEDFLTSNLLVEGDEFEVQDITGDTFQVDKKKTVSFAPEDLEAVETFSETAAYFVDGVKQDSLPPPAVFQGKKDPAMMVTLDESGNLERASIVEETTGDSISFIPTAEGSTTFVTVKESDIDEEKLSMYKYGEPEIAPDNYLSANSLEAYSAPKTFISNSNSNKNKNNTFRALQSVDCPSYRVIELAIAYDTSFCSFFGGKAAADRKVQTIISGVSDMYKQKGLCMMVVMSHLEGYCNPAVDPYREMLEANNANACSVLYPLQQFWADERADVQKDAMHLFHGYNLPTNTIGCAFVSVLCGDYALAVNEISYTTNQGLQNILVAHELGHNAGANHCSGCTNIMRSSICGQCKAFSQQSIGSMSSHANSKTCLEVITSPFPTVSPTMSPTIRPSSEPTPFPTRMPTGYPTGGPTEFSSSPSESTPLPTEVATPGPSPIPSKAPTTEEPTPGPSRMPVTVSPTKTPTLLPTVNPTARPSPSPSKAPVTPEPTPSPSGIPVTVSPTKEPTTLPTVGPTALPTSSPTVPRDDDGDGNGENAPPGSTGSPTDKPSSGPTKSPTLAPTHIPTHTPTTAPTETPTHIPTYTPTTIPTEAPTMSPTRLPTASPSGIPTANPSTESPTVASGHPSEFPTTSTPTVRPTDSPTGSPTPKPTGKPTQRPTKSPTASPTPKPTGSPTESPTVAEKEAPVPPPTYFPTTGPTAFPTVSPTVGRTEGPTQVPSDPRSEGTLAPSDPPTLLPMSSLHWVICGKPNRCTEENKIADAGELHEVRCCSDDDAYPGPGWVKNSGCGVWAESDLAGPTGSKRCYSNRNLQEAQKICTLSNARLCTKDELEASCATRTGCLHDRDLVWSSTAAYPDPTSTPSRGPIPFPTGGPSTGPSLAPTMVPIAFPTVAPFEREWTNPPATTAPTYDFIDTPISDDETEVDKNLPSTPAPSDIKTIAPTTGDSGVIIDLPPAVMPPTSKPTASPTTNPSGNPSGSPSISPSTNPSKSPTENPSGSPTKSPSAVPSKPPTESPSIAPSVVCQDNQSVTFRFSSGRIADCEYFANHHPDYFCQFSLISKYCPAACSKC